MAKKNDAKEKGPMIVLTLPLHVRPWEADVLTKRFRVCGSIYNAMLGHLLKVYDSLCQNPEYAATKELTDLVRKNDNSAEAREKAKEIKKTPKYKAAVKLQMQMNKDAGFTEFGFIALVAQFRDHFKDIIPSNLAAKSIASPMWSAFEKLLYKDGKNCKFKRSTDFSSVATDGKSGIRIVDELGNTARKIEPDPGRKYSVLVSSKKGKQLCLPIVIDRKDRYVIDSLGRDIKIVRIAKKMVKGKPQYSLQITMSGAPAVKHDHDGNLLHPIGKGRIAVFLDERYFTVVDEAGNVTEIDIDFPDKYEEKIHDIQFRMDGSKRATNPQNYNPDGTPVKSKDEPGEKLKWNYSKTYNRYRAQKADIDRKQRESREIRSNIIASRILAMGDDITINDRSFKTNVGGHEYHDRIRRNSPSQIITKLENKLKAAGLGELHRYKLKVEKEDKAKDGYRAEYAKKLLYARLEECGER